MKIGSGELRGNKTGEHSLRCATWQIDRDSVAREDETSGAAGETDCKLGFLEHGVTLRHFV